VLKNNEEIAQKNNFVYLAKYAISKILFSGNVKLLSSAKIGFFAAVKSLQNCKIKILTKHTISKIAKFKHRNKYLL